MAKLNQITIGGKLYIEVNANPVGLQAPVGSAAVWNNNGVGSYYFKNGSSDTSWEQVPTLSDLEKLVAAEATARDAAIAVEATARDAAISSAVSAEATARDAAIAVEATARDAAISSAVSAEATARDAAIAVEATARDAAISSAIGSIPATDLTPYVKHDGTVAMTGDLNMGEKKITNVSVIEGKKVTTGVDPINGMQVTVGSFRFDDGTRYDGSLVFTYRNDLKVFSYLHSQVEGGPNAWDIFHAAFPTATDFSTYRGLLSIYDINNNKVCEVTHAGSNYIIASWMNGPEEGFGVYDSHFTMVDTLSTVESPVVFSTGVDAGGKAINNVGPAVNDTDAINKAQLTSAINSVSDGAGVSLGQEVIDREAADAILQSAIDAEVLARQTADESLQDQIDAEVLARMSADAELRPMIEKEVADRTSADDAIQTSITNLQTALTDETTARANADTAIQTKNTEQDTAISNLQSGVANVQSNLDTAVTQLTAKDTQIAADLSTLTSDVGALSARHDTELETERQARSAADDLKMDKAGGAFSGPIDMSGFELNNLPAATQSNQPATYAQLNTSVQALVNSIHARQSCKCFTNDSRLVDGVDLSSILPFSDDESPITIVLSDLLVGDYILAGVTPKLFKVVDDNGTKRVTTVGVDQPAEGLSYFVAWDLVNTPAELENCSVQAVVNNKLIKIADVNFQYATGINLSATYAKAAAKAAIQATDSLEVAISKLEKNLEVAKAELQTAMDEAIVTEVTNRNSAIEAAKTLLQTAITAEEEARIAEDAKKLDLAGGTMTGDIDMNDKKLVNVNTIEGKKVTTGVAPVNGMQVTVGSFRFADGTRWDGSLLFTYRDDLRFNMKVFSYLHSQVEGGPNAWDVFHTAFPTANWDFTDHGLLSIHDVAGNKVCEVTYTGGYIAAWSGQDNAMNFIEGYGAYSSNFTMVNTASTVESPVLFSTGIDAGGKVIPNVATGVNANDAVNKAQLEAAINAVSAGAGANLGQEVADRQAADDALQTALNAEIAARTAADQSLKTELQEDYNAKFNLTASAQELFDEVAARTAADTLIRTDFAAADLAEKNERITEDAKKLDLAGGTMTGDINMNDKKLVNVNTIEGKKVTTGVALVNGTKVRIAKFVSSAGITINGSGGGLEFTYRTDIPSTTNPAFVYYNGKNDLSVGDEFYATYAGFNPSGNYGTHISAFDANDNEVFRVVPNDSNFYFAMFTSAAVDYFGPYGTRMTTFASQSTTESPVLFSTGVDAGGKAINNVGPAVNDTDAINKAQLTSAINSVSDGAGASVAQEVSDRIAADTALQTNIDTVSTNLNSLSSRHDTEMETERNARIAADALKMDKAGGTFSGAVDMGGNALNNIPAATLGNQPATYAQLNTAVQTFVNSVHARQSCKCFTNDVRLVEGVDLSTILPFTDDEGTPTIVLADLVVGDYILAHVNSPKLFKVIDDNGVKKATLVGVDQPAEQLSYFVAWDLVNTPAELENCTVQAVIAGKLVKIADMNWQYATGINLSATFAAALAASEVQAGDSIENALSKIVKNLKVEQDARTAALNSEIATREAADLALDTKITDEKNAREAAIAVEATARAAADLAEITARNAAIASNAWHLEIVGNVDSSLELAVNGQAVEQKYFETMYASAISPFSDISVDRKSEVAIERKSKLVATLRFYAELKISGVTKVLSFKKTFTSKDDVVLLVQDEYTQEDIDLIGANLSITVTSLDALTHIRATLTGLPIFDAGTLSGMMHVDVLAD